MSQKNSSRRAGTVGVKALIAAASIAATIAGWALLPSNDPQQEGAAAAATGSQVSPPALSVPGITDPGTITTPNQSQSMPQINPFQGFSNSLRPFTRSHSSR